jgi:uncharacterized protein YndB with AHSA1/START domain/predicted enzyme related to lactoylglutathione lyase
MTIRGIGGIFFKCADPPTMARWYQEHLGIHQSEDGSVVLGWRHLDRPDALGLTVWAPFSADTTYFAPSPASWMVNFIVADLDAMLARLQQSGVEMAGEPEAFDFGRFAWILDCEGNKVELWQPASGIPFSPTVPAGVDTTRLGDVLCAPGTSIATDAAGMQPEMIIKARDIQLSIDEVWRLWTSSEALAEWLVAESRIELRVGGAYEFYFLPDGDTHARGGEGCKILSFLPPRMLSFTWNAPPHLEHTRARYTHVVLELEARGAGTTHVCLTHLGWPSAEVDDHEQWPRTFAYFDDAWSRVLDALEAFAERTPAPPQP